MRTVQKGRKQEQANNWPEIIDKLPEHSIWLEMIPINVEYGWGLLWKNARLCPLVLLNKADGRAGKKIEVVWN